VTLIFFLNFYSCISGAPFSSLACTTHQLLLSWQQAYIYADLGFFYASLFASLEQPYRTNWRTDEQNGRNAAY